MLSCEQNQLDLFAMNKMARTAQCRITRLDKYEMLETVGEGAYGVVWKARNRGD